MTEKQEFDLPGYQKTPFMRMMEDTFTDQEVLAVAYYIISAIAVGESLQSAFMQNKDRVAGLPPAALDIVYRFDSGLTNNEFFIKNYAHIKMATVIDRVKLSSGSQLVAMGEKHGDRQAFSAALNLFLEKMDALIVVAFLWKGYEFAKEFTCKLRLLHKAEGPLREYFEKRIGGTF